MIPAYHLQTSDATLHAVVLTSYGKPFHTGRLKSVQLALPRLATLVLRLDGVERIDSTEIEALLVVIIVLVEVRTIHIAPERFS